jgi:DNA-binding CsgD family transcriptional regulator/catechol 2,3-dioxygenase-like lactoylglutathione lyase family enzyme
MPHRSRRGRPAHDDVLTPAEWRIAHGIQHGMTNREIAARRGISLDAVKFHVSNVLAKLGLEDRKALRTWFRVPRDSSLNRKQDGAPMSLGRIGQIARSVSDIERAKAFYGEVLRLPHLYTFGNLAFFDCDGTRLMLSQNETPASNESLLYLLVENIEACYGELRSRGVEFLSAPHMIHRHADGTEEWMAFFKDPDDRPLALMAQVKS